MQVNNVSSNQNFGAIKIGPGVIDFFRDKSGKVDQYYRSVCKIQKKNPIDIYIKKIGNKKLEFKVGKDDQYKFKTGWFSSPFSTFNRAVNCAEIINLLGK